MVDEVGEHISQKGDGNAGGQKFMVVYDMRAQVQNSFKYNHFTVLGFTTAMGEAVMCGSIIAASKLKVNYFTDVNPLSEVCGNYDKEEWQKLED
jgi:hypothetical protein